MTTERMKETVSKYVAGMEYIKNVCGKSGGRIVQQDFRQATKLSAIAIKGMVHLGYLKKISRGVYAWNLGDIVEPKAARNVHEYVLNYFKQNAIKRENKVVEPKEEDLMAQDLIPSTPEEDIEALKDWINDLCRQKTDLIRDVDEAHNEIKAAMKWIEDLRHEAEVWENMHDDVAHELAKMKEDHNAIVKDIMDTPRLICTSEDNEPASKTYYFLGIPLWSIKFK